MLSQVRDEMRRINLNGIPTRCLARDAGIPVVSGVASRSLTLDDIEQSMPQIDSTENDMEIEMIASSSDDED